MSCGAEVNHQVVCLDVVGQTPVDASSTTCTVTIRYSTSSIAFGFDDPQTLRAYGEIVGTWDFNFHTDFGSTQNVVVIDQSKTVPISTGGSGTYGFGAQIHGQYLGGEPLHVLYWTAPTRPSGGVPGAPGISVSNITANTAYINITAPASNGGSAIDQYEVYVDDDPAFGSWATAWNGASGTATNLLAARLYYARTRCHNASGWSPYATTSFTTLAGAMAKYNGGWLPATGKVKVGSAWLPMERMWKKVNGTWVL